MRRYEWVGRALSGRVSDRERKLTPEPATAQGRRLEVLERAQERMPRSWNRNGGNKNPRRAHVWQHAEQRHAALVEAPLELRRGDRVVALRHLVDDRPQERHLVCVCVCHRLCV